MTARHIPTLLLTLLAFGLPIRAAEHPVPLEKDADCATCHEDKTKGKAVHSAIAMGCTTCHEVKTENDVTTVNLVSPKEELCFTCHEKSQDAVRHLPYDQGRCVVCHDPHTSDTEKQLRAEGNQLCLACHLERRTTDTTVQLFGGKATISDSDFMQIPKIGLLPNLKAGHPMGAHPVADYPDPTRPGTKMSCLTCHQHHSSKQEKLMRVSEKKGEDFCDACHLANDNRRMEEAEKAIQLREMQKQQQQTEGKDKKKNGEK